MMQYAGFVTLVGIQQSLGLPPEWFERVRALPSPTLNEGMTPVIIVIKDKFNIYVSTHSVHSLNI